MRGVAVFADARYRAGDFYRVFRPGACLNEVAQTPYFIPEFGEAPP